MKIAQVSPLQESVPPQAYGGTERIVAYLCDALVGLGHEVTLFASGDADTRARLVAVRDQALRLDPRPLKSDLAANLRMLHEVRERADEFDLLHFHIDLIHFPFFEDCAGRTVTTLHGRQDVVDLGNVYERWPQFPLVSISGDQRTPLASANWLGTVYHGLPAEKFRFSPQPAGGYLAFLGRISVEKRVDRAIRIAKLAGRKLKIAAKIDPIDQSYYEESIKPLLDDPLVEYVGEKGEAEKVDLLRDADALLFPIDWPEPFGLVMIEAMACGTPVIAWNCGSVPEVIEPGVTGFVVNSEEEAVEAVRNIPTLDRRRIRSAFDKRFSADAMARNYVRLYERLLEREERTGDAA